MAQTKKLVDELYDRLNTQGRLASTDFLSLLPDAVSKEETVIENEWDLANFVAEIGHCETVDLRQISPDPAVKSLLSIKLIRRLHVLPLYLDEQDQLVVAQYDPLDLRSSDRIRRASGHEVRIVVAPKEQVLRYVDRLYGSEEEAEVERFIRVSSNEVKARAQEANGSKWLFRDIEEDLGTTSVSQLLEAIIQHALKRRATDIHITCSDEGISLKHRLDGVLQEGMRIPHDLHAALLSRIKLSAGMDISNRRLPQDGQIELKVADRKIQIRVAVFPTIHGEDVAMRLLQQGGYLRDFSSLGIADSKLVTFRNMLDSTKGMVLVTGPVGVGKTTTLYAALSYIAESKRRIITLEDPVECRLENMTQSQISPETGYDFAAGLRSILRMDPDVIMVGEIRDVETAQMALRASLTGMLVLSTLHTDRVAGAVPRLLDMQVEPFLLNSSILGVISQALVRKICSECRIEMRLTTDFVKQHRLPEDLLNKTFWKGTGCDRCENTGFFGRVGLFEILPITDDVRTEIRNRSDTPGFERAAHAAGMQTLFEDGLQKASEGITSIPEVIRVLHGRQ